MWQGEQLELSFKAHLCASGVYECPCSRIAHHRNLNFKRFGEDGVDYMIRNFKRIAEVWLDDYKEVVYARNSAKFADADIGDLVRAKGIKMGLHCKPFSYFLEFVAPEMLERYPLVSPGVFAQGVIQSKANPDLCLEAGPKRQIILANCEKNFVQPSPKQFFKLAWHRNIQHHIYDFCLQDSLTIAECHFRGGNQFWKYDLVIGNFSFGHCVAILFSFLELFEVLFNKMTRAAKLSPRLATRSLLIFLVARFSDDKSITQAQPKPNSMPDI